MESRRDHAELVEDHRLAQDMSATLADFRACRTELLSCFTTDDNSLSYTAVEDGDTGVKGWCWSPGLDNTFSWFLFRKKQILLCLLAVKEGLTHSSILELMKKLNSHEEELGKIIYF